MPGALKIDEITNKNEGFDAGVHVGVYRYACRASSSNEGSGRTAGRFQGDAVPLVATDTGHPEDTRGRDRANGHLDSGKLPGRVPARLRVQPSRTGGSVSSKQPGSGKSARKRAVTPAKREAGRNMLQFRKARPNVVHGVNALLTTGTIPPELPGATEISGFVDSLVREMIRDLGCENEDALPAQKKVLLRSERFCLLVIELAHRHIAETGSVVGKRGKPHPLLRTVVPYINAMNRLATVLGIERRQRKVGPTSLAEYLDSSPPAVPEASVSVDEVKP